MLEASHLAGRAIDVTSTTAPHALSYELTSAFGVAHGHAVALMLGSIFEYNAAVTDLDCADRRGTAYVRDTLDDIAGSLGASSAREAHAVISELLSTIGVAKTLEGVGAGSPDAKHSIALAVDPDRLSGNPRVFAQDTLLALVGAIP